jgi:hypothetical protein
MNALWVSTDTLGESGRHASSIGARIRSAPSSLGEMRSGADAAARHEKTKAYL